MPIALPVVKTRQPPIRDYISHSSISLFQSCSLRWMFRYVEDLPEDTVSASLVVGSGIHAGMEHHFRELLTGNEPPSLDTLLETFWESWHDHDHQAITFPKGEDINSVGHLAERMLRAFQVSDFAKPPGTIIGVEEELRGQLLPGLPDLLARVDLLTDEGDALVITDMKTSRSGWSQEHVTDSAGQLLLYHELAKDLADGRPVRLRFVVLTKSKLPDLMIHEVEVDVRQLERTKRIVERVWAAIRLGAFYPSPSPLNCSGCPYRKPCKQWSG